MLHRVRLHRLFKHGKAIPRVAVSTHKQVHRSITVLRPRMNADVRLGEEQNPRHSFILLERVQVCLEDRRPTRTRGSSKDLR